MKQRTSHIFFMLRLILCLALFVLLAPDRQGRSLTRDDMETPCCVSQEEGNICLMSPGRDECDDMGGLVVPDCEQCVGDESYDAHSNEVYCCFQGHCTMAASGRDCGFAGGRTVAHCGQCQK